MTDISYPDASESPLLTGTILNTPADASAELLVRIDSYGTQDAREVVNWDPHGQTLPTAGAACLVGRDEDGGWWVISWVGGWS